MRQLELPFPPEYIEIPLSKRSKKYAGLYVTIVSQEDADLAELNWKVKGVTGNTQYAVRNINRKGKYTEVILHRVILERSLGRPLEKHEDVDHIDQNGLNNTRTNLRPATRTQNQANKGLQRSNTSGYKGIVWLEREQKWYAQIRVNRRGIYLGRYKTKEDAYAAYCEAAKKYFGEFAYLGDTAA